MARYGMAIDTKRCVGCNACTLACKQANNVPDGVFWTRVLTDGGDMPDTPASKDGKLSMRYFAMGCQHCANPACVETCPTGAMQKSADTGVVNSDPNVCIGCGTCVESCPYGAPHLDEEAGHVTKCDMCQALVEAGEQPACVESCPTRALYFGELAELAERFPGTDALIEPLPETDTAPSLFVLPHKDAQRSGAGTGAVIFAVDEV